MSYILDALRKSEQQRLRDEAPLLMTTQVISDVKQQPAFLFYGLLAATLIGAGILIGWLRPWQHDETAAAKDSIALAQQETKSPQIAPIPQPIPQSFQLESEKNRKSEPVLPAQKSIPATKLVAEKDNLEQDIPIPVPNITAKNIAKITAQPPQSQASTTLPKASEQKAPEQMVVDAATPTTEKAIPPSPEPSSSNDTNSASNEPAQERKIVAMAELPPAIQQEIPKMTISGYAYSSTPKERSVGINDRLLQEGEYLAPGLRLEQINEDGLVFSYKKYLFRHSL
jgi:general secretion pathway protein B